MPNKTMIQKLEGAGYRIDVGEEKIRTTCTLNSMLATLEDFKGLPFAHTANRYSAHRSMISDDYWREKGGTAQALKDALAGKQDMGPFEAARLKLAGSGLLDRLQTHAADVSPRRKRRMSEHDGELDLARIYEIQPFYATHKTLQTDRTIELVCNFSISGFARPESIDEYGALVWSIADVIEAAGIKTRIILFEDGKEVDRRQRLVLEQAFILKEPWEYLPPSLLATAFSANFYRRAVFAMIAIGCDAYGYEVSEGLGKPIKRELPVQFSDGKLHLSPHALIGYSAEIESQVMSAINWNRSEVS